MRRVSVVIFLIFSFTYSSGLLGARLPQNISVADLRVLVKTLAFGNTTKVMRSAEAYPVYPGLRVSVETSLVRSGELSEMGNGTASLPVVIPSPRLTLTKGLGMGLEAAMNISTQQLINTISTFGLLGKWTLIDEQDSFATSAIFTSYTSLNGFSDNFRGSNFEAGFVASQDYVRIKPYVGMGLLLASGTVPRSICVESQQSTIFSPHLFLGAEIELPMNITFQMDFTDWIPTGSLALGYKF